MFSSFCFLSVLEGTKTSCRKRNLTYFLGQNCLPSIWYQKIPIFVCFFPPKIQQTSCTESTAGISRSLLHGQSQPPLEQGSAGRGQPEPKVQRTFCLFILPFQPGKDKLMSSAFSSLWLSFYTAERKRSYAQIFPPKQLSEYNKDKKQSDPPQFCSSVTPQDKGYSHNSFFLLSGRKHKPRFPKALVVGSQAPQTRILFQHNKFHLLSTYFASHDTSFFTYLFINSN